MSRFETDLDDYHTRVLSRHRDIRENRAYSEKTINNIQNRVRDFPPNIFGGIKCLAACGSYARMEASEHSDLDFLIVCEPTVDGSVLRKKMNELLKELGLPLPNPKGVFAENGDIDKLLTSAGSTEETYGDLSKRLLLLLESRPLALNEGYDDIIKQVVDQYTEDVAADPNKNFVYLLNDLARYFRTICVNYQHTKSGEWGKWPLRNIKLRHSRVLMYFSLIAVLGELSTYTAADKVDLLKEYIKLTPLERLYLVYHNRQDTNFFRFVGSYDVFLRMLSDQETRQKLKDLEYDDRYKSREFATLKANSDALAAEITRFVFARRGQWSDRFFEYLVI